MSEITRKPVVQEQTLYWRELDSTEKLLKELGEMQPDTVDISRADDILRARLEAQNSFFDRPSVLDVRQKLLNEEERNRIKKETGWSNEIIDAFGSVEEYEIYKEAGLVEVEIGGKKCLVRNDIDWEQKDAFGRTNRDRAELGLSPINKEGNVIELHHIGQHADSPLAELTPEEHRGKGNDAVLHDKTKETEIDRQAFAGERADHWEARAKEGSDSNCQQS